MLQYIDKIGVFDRTVAHPFLLLDGHHSRMMLLYLQYNSIFVNPATNGTHALEYPMPLMSGKLLMPAP